MAFDSFSAFIAMDGHGPYVWACYGVFFVAMVVLMAGSVRSRNAIIDSCRRGYETQADKSRVASSTPSATFTRVKLPQD